MIQVQRRVWSVGLFALAAIGALTVPTAARAAAPVDDTVSWSVRPAGENGPDGRAWMELELEPGTSVVEHVAVTNLGERTVTFGVQSADGYFTDTGRFNILPAGETSHGAGTWLTVADAVTVDAGKTAILPLTIDVPDTATPGDHAAGVAATIVSEGQSDGATVSVESRVGFRVMIRVAGDLEPRLDVDLTSTYVTEWNPFEPGSIEVAYRLSNQGNVRMTANAVVTGAAPSGETELLPRDERTQDVQVTQTWPSGLVSVTVTVQQAVVLPDGTREPLTPIVRTVEVWAMPWPQLLIVIGVALLVVALFWRRRRTRRHISQLVARAREQGRREAEGA